MRGQETPLEGITKMLVNDEGLALIKESEGLHRKVGDDLYKTYYCPSNVLTIGYGTTGARVKPGMTINKAQAEQLLAEDVKEFSKLVEQLCKQLPWQVNENQFSALVSFAYNCGINALRGSTAFKQLKQNDIPGAMDALQWWNKGSGRKVLPGLVKRRAREAKLFLSEVPNSGEKFDYANDDTDKHTKPVSEEQTIKLQQIYQDDLVIDYEVLNDEEYQDLAVQVQVRLIALNLLQPPADGKFGTLSTGALQEFQRIMGCDDDGIDKDTAKKLIETKELPRIEIRTQDNFAKALVNHMQDKGYKVFEGSKKFNLIHIEGMDLDGTANADQFDRWNDLRLIFEIASDGSMAIVGKWIATTEPGAYYTYNPMNRKGAARIALAQFTAWQMGTHGRARPHKALVQTGGAVTVHRDFNKDGSRTNDRLDTGYFGINIHADYDKRRNLTKEQLRGVPIKLASAGCEVVRSFQDHLLSMSILEGDVRYQANRKFVFTNATLDGSKLYV